MNHHVTKTCIIIKFIILNCWSTQEKSAIILILFISIQFETRTFHEQFAATKRSKTLPFAVISNPSVCNNQHHLSRYFYLFVSSPSPSSSSLGQSRPTAGKAYGWEGLGRQGLVGISLCASGAQLRPMGSNDFSDKQTDTSS